MGGYTASDAARVATPSAVCRVSHRDRPCPGGLLSALAELLRSGIHRDPPIARRQKALDFGAMEFVDLENDALEEVGGVDLVLDVTGGERSAFNPTERISGQTIIRVRL